MSEVSGASISKGVFICKGKKLKANQKDYVSSKKIGDFESDLNIRMELFESLWSKTFAKITSLQSELHRRVADDLLKFVERSHAGIERDCRCKQQRLIREIPTAAFVTGVNTPDHSTMFSNLTSMLKKQVTPHVAVLRSICCQTIHSIISETVSQLLNTSDHLEKEEEEEDVATEVLHGQPPVKKRTSCTMSSISRWYASLYKKQFGLESPEDASSVKHPPEVMTLDRMNSPDKGNALFTTSSTPLRSPQKHIPDNALESRVRSPCTPTTPQKRRESPEKKILYDSPKNSLSNTPRKLAKELRRSPRRKVVDDSIKPLIVTPQKSARSLVRSTQNLRCSPRKMKTSADDSCKALFGISEKATTDHLKSPQKRRNSPQKMKFKEGLSPPMTEAQKVWSSPRRVLPDSRQSMAESPRKGVGTPSKAARSKKSLDFRKPARLVNPVVVVIEDFEGFPSQVLQDFITICGHHLDELPLVLVFGIATTQNAVHRVLPHAVSSMLSMERFQAPPSSEHFSLVLKEVLMTNAFPYKLSAKVFSFLLDIFLYHDFSVTGFIQALKYTMLEHFYSNPSSILCQNDKDVSQKVALMSPKQLDNVRSCPSFRKFVERCQPVEQIKLLDDNNYVKKVIMKHVESLEAYHSSFYPVMMCLHLLVHKLPQWPLGKQVRELYALCLSSNIFDLPDYEHAFSLIRSLSREELRMNLHQMASYLEADGTPSELAKVRVRIRDFCKEFEQLSDMHLSCSVGKSEESSASSQTLPKKLDLFTLKQKLQEMDSKKKIPTMFEGLRTEAVDYLDSIFRKYLRSYKNLVLHEVLYFDGLDQIRYNINACPRITMQNALTHPRCYLPNDALNLDPGQLTSDLPDISIVYKLHLECGRLINLYDWLQAFVMIVQSESDEQKSKKGKGKTSIDRVLQARFIQAVSELQFLGFIKPTRRKTDHVARLTWGGC